MLEATDKYSELDRQRQQSQYDEIRRLQLLQDEALLARTHIDRIGLGQDQMLGECHMTGYD